MSNKETVECCYNCKWRESQWCVLDRKNKERINYDMICRSYDCAGEDDIKYLPQIYLDFKKWIERGNSFEITNGDGKVVAIFFPKKDTKNIVRVIDERLGNSVEFRMTKVNFYTHMLYHIANTEIKSPVSINPYTGLLELNLIDYSDNEVAFMISRYKELKKNNENRIVENKIK